MVVFNVLLYECGKYVECDVVLVVCICESGVVIVYFNVVGG